MEKIDKKFWIKIAVLTLQINEEICFAYRSSLKAFDSTCHI
jgi:hypothetical protein